MRARENLRSSFKSILHNKLRSLLTMLGIIIGIFSVTMATSIGNGVKKQVVSQIESLGANLVYVFPGQVSTGLTQGKSKLGVQAQSLGQAQSTLIYSDALALKGKKGIAAVTCIFNGIDWLDELKIYASTTGVDEDYPQITKLDLRYGRFFSKHELQNKQRVSFIGDEANKELFKGRNSVGNTFKINGLDYKVIGVMKHIKLEELGSTGNDLNVRIYLPVTEMMTHEKQKNLTQIMVKARSAGAVGTVQETVRKTMLQRHGGVDFSVVKQQDMLDTINKLIGTLTAGFGGIAGISLVVGGIGIMNIMLVSVAERTREIGVRKSIGAPQRDILLQFLIEAVVLSLIGGLTGLLLGIGGARLIPLAFPSIHTAVSFSAAIIALVFSLLAGVFFGVYPAAKAARLDPIEALRSE